MNSRTEENQKTKTTKTSKMNLLALVLMLGWQADLIESAGSCIGSKNKPVDWFIIYKMPRIKDNAFPKFRTGEGMMYMDVYHPEWEPLDEGTSSEHQPLYYTLDQIYKAADSTSKDTIYLMYNDRTPLEKTSSSKAHAKGAVYFDKVSGFWLIHSVPSFPSIGSYRYPASGTIFGQTFICVTFGPDQMSSIGKQLSLINPQLYGTHASPSFKISAPELWSLAVENAPPKGPKSKANKSSALSLKSLGGVEFTSFAKSRRFNKGRTFLL